MAISTIFNTIFKSIRARQKNRKQALNRIFKHSRQLEQTTSFDQLNSGQQIAPSGVAHCSINARDRDLSGASQG
jgi:hypothetical protein